MTRAARAVQRNAHVYSRPPTMRNDEDASVAKDPARAVLPQEWAPYAGVPSCSGTECCDALQRAGLEIKLDGPDMSVVLRDGLPVAIVPMFERLRLGMIIAILEGAGVGPEEFIAHLVVSPSTSTPIST